MGLDNHNSFESHSPCQWALNVHRDLSIKWNELTKQNQKENMDLSNWKLNQTPIKMNGNLYEHSSRELIWVKSEPSKVHHSYPLQPVKIEPNTNKNGWQSPWTPTSRESIRVKSEPWQIHHSSSANSRSSSPTSHWRLNPAKATIGLRTNTRKEKIASTQQKITHLLEG